MKWVLLHIRTLFFIDDFTAITTTPILIPLSGLARGNFCFNLLLPFLSIVRILSPQAILFQILLYALFPGFPWSTCLPFPSYFNFHNLTYLGSDVSTQDMTIPPQMASTYIPNLHNNTTLSRRTSVDTLSTSLTPHIILIIRDSTLCNLASSATVNSHAS